MTKKLETHDVEFLYGSPEYTAIFAARCPNCNSKINLVLSLSGRQDLGKCSCGIMWNIEIKATGVLPFDD